MKLKKIMGLSILAASAISIISCINRTTPSELLNDENIVIEENSSNPTPSDGYCLLTFDANGGKFDDGTSTTFFQVRKGHNWARIKDKVSIPMTDADWSFKPSEKEFKLWKTRENKSIFDEYVFNEDNVTLTAKWGDPYVTSAFSTASWDNLIEKANQGYETVKAAYATGKLAGDSFIIQDLNDREEIKSKTRYVNIEGLKNPLYGKDGYDDIKNECDWPVHVIGINHDLIKDSPNTVATLTFEFEYSPMPSVGWDYVFADGHQSWEKSPLRENLNSYLYLQFDDQLYSGVQTVLKNVDDGNGNDRIATLGEKVFLPSCSELYNPDAVNQNVRKISSYENSQYDYYVLHSASDDNDLIKGNPFLRIDNPSYNPTTDPRKEIPSPTTCWLRSPSVVAYRDEPMAMTIDCNIDPVDDANPNASVVNHQHSVCPCFAIGENPVCAVTARIEDGLVFETKDPFTIAGSNKNFETRVKLSDELGGYRVPYDLVDKIKITVNGTTSVLLTDKDFIYDSGNGNLSIKGESIPEGSTLITIDLSPSMSKFQAASWDEIVEVASYDVGDVSTIEYFKKYFGYQLSDTLVGLQKYLTIDGVKYRTRIIGEAHDSLAGEGTTDKATLTFEFIDAIESGVYDDTDCRNFPESELNFRLSSFAQDKIPFTLAEVKKTVLTDIDGDDSWDMSSYNAKLFPLSENEYAGVNYATQPDREGHQYRYYSSGDPNPCKYLPGTKTIVPTWLRTPNAKNWVTDPNPGYYCLTSSTNIRYKTDIGYGTPHNDIHYTAPAFCIGHNMEVAL